MSNSILNAKIEDKVRLIKKGFKDMKKEFDIAHELSDELDRIINDLKRIKKNAKAASRFINEYECEVIELEETDQSPPQEIMQNQMGDGDQNIESASIS